MKVFDAYLHIRNQFHPTLAHKILHSKYAAIWLAKSVELESVATYTNHFSKFLQLSRVHYHWPCGNFILRSKVAQTVLHIDFHSSLIKRNQCIEYKKIITWKRWKSHVPTSLLFLDTPMILILPVSTHNYGPR